MPWRAWKPSFTGNTWSLLSAIRANWEQTDKQVQRRVRHGCGRLGKATVDCTGLGHPCAEPGGTWSFNRLRASLRGPQQWGANQGPPGAGWGRHHLLHLFESLPSWEQKKTDCPVGWTHGLGRCIFDLRTLACFSPKYLLIILFKTNTLESSQSNFRIKFRHPRSTRLMKGVPPFTTNAMRVRPIASSASWIRRRIRSSWPGTLNIQSRGTATEALPAFKMFLIVFYWLQKQHIYYEKNLRKNFKSKLEEKQGLFTMDLPYEFVVRSYWHWHLCRLLYSFNADTCTFSKSGQGVSHCFAILFTYSITYWEHRNKNNDEPHGRALI